VGRVHADPPRPLSNPLRAARSDDGEHRPSGEREADGVQ
jgi:hypothetical protein